MAIIGFIIIIASLLYDASRNNQMMKSQQQQQPWVPVMYDAHGACYWKRTGQRCAVVRDGKFNKVMDYSTGSVIAMIPPEDWMTYNMPPELKEKLKEAQKV